ncbi:MAG: response regulator transcription factor [Cyanobacteriota bacterium]
MPVVVERAPPGGMMRLLVVEDDPELRGALLQLLDRWGYATEAAADGPSALALTVSRNFDLVLLDVALPGCDGLEVCRRLRGRSTWQPLILMLTARDTSADKVQGLDHGADDYVVKPFDPVVLQARIRALLRRSDRPLHPVLVWGPLQLTAGQSRLRVGETWLDLTRKEALLLECLLRAQGQSCSKSQLLDASSSGPREVGEDTVKAHMRNLRSKLTAAGCPPDLIETVYGLGYRLNPCHIA